MTSGQIKATIQREMAKYSNIKTQYNKSKNNLSGGGSVKIINICLCRAEQHLSTGNDIYGN